MDTAATILLMADGVVVTVVDDGIVVVGFNAAGGIVERGGFVNSGGFVATGCLESIDVLD